MRKIVVIHTDGKTFPAKIKNFKFENGKGRGVAYIEGFLKEWCRKNSTTLLRYEIRPWLHAEPEAEEI